MLKAVFMAMGNEAEDVLAQKDFGYAKLCAHPFEAWRNETRLIVLSGIGLVNASLAFAWAAKNFEFECALNVGAAGATDLHGDGLELGGLCKVSKVSCLEPYNEEVFALSETGRTLVTSSRPVESKQERAAAAKFGQLVDMEGYAFAKAAMLYSKKLEMYKIVTDFSDKCNIRENIKKLRWRLAHLDGVWR